MHCKIFFNFAVFNKDKLIEVEKLFQLRKSIFYALTSQKKYDIGVLPLAYIIMMYAFLSLSELNKG